jgi:DNA-binding LacI/PurR family transcriptional regulator
MRKNIRLADIARRIGIDVSTASRALRDDPRVRKETIDRVKAESDRVGYRPFLPARHLVTGRTGTVWMLLPGLDSPIEREPAAVASDLLAGAGLDLLIVQHRNHPEHYERLLSRLEQGLCDAAIVIPGPDKASPTEKTLVTRKFPLVYLDRIPAGIKADSVTSANSRAVERMLAEPNGFRTRTWISLFTEANSVERSRAEGLTKSCRETGRDCLDPGVFGSGSTVPDIIGLAASTQQAILEFLQIHGPILQGRILEALCFDDWKGPAAPFRRISFAVQDFASLAERAVQSLRERLGSAESPARTFEIDCLRFVTLPS